MRGRGAIEFGLLQGRLPVLGDRFFLLWRAMLVEFSACVSAALGYIHP